MADIPRAVDPLVPLLRLVFGTILPIATVAGALIFTIQPNFSSNFGTLINDDDIEEERERDKKQAAAESSVLDGPSETTPLLGKPTQLSGRGLKNTAFILLGLTELVLHATSLFNAVVRGSHIVPGAISVAVWVYGVLDPLFRPSRRPPYPLFSLYLLALATTSLDLYLLGISDRLLVLTTWYLLHVAACLTGVLICLSMPMRPNADSDEVQRVNISLAMDEYATLGQWLTVSWMGPLFERARTGALHETDIFRIATDSRARLLARKFESFMPQTKLLRRVALANWGTISMILVTKAMGGALLSLQPVLIQRILAALSETSSDQVHSSDISLIALVLAPNEVTRKDTRTAYLFAGIAFAFLIIRTHLAVVTTMVERRFYTHARASVIGVVYRKALVRIDTSGIVDSTTTGKDGTAQGGKADMGKVVSLVGSDVGLVASLPGILDVLTQGPINLSILCWFLYSMLGVSAFVGYVIFLVVAPYTSWCMTILMEQYRAVSRKRDICTRAISEMLQSMKFIKFSGWETQWGARVNAHRDAELAQRFRMLIVHELFNLTWRIVPIIITSITLTWFTVVQGRQLTIEIAFPVIIALNQLTMELNNAPSKFGRYADLAAAYGRLDEFLDEDEVDERTSMLKMGTQGRQHESDQRVGAEAATFRWHKHTVKTPTTNGKKVHWRDRFKRIFSRSPPETIAASPTIEIEPFQLRDITILCPRGRLSVITGPTGSGKSSLLAALLGEMHLMSGTVFLPKATHVVDPETGLLSGVSFCAQHPWLESKTIRENILFGSPYEEERYKTVLDVCSLNADLAILGNGDETEIGDRGVVLSGGQKARVALARAVYSRMQNVLLDDVLSAVDTHTARILINKCLFGPIMNDRTVLLVTHHLVSVVHGAAWIVKMENGGIKTQGTPDELRRSGELDTSSNTRAEGAENVDGEAAKGDGAKEQSKDEKKSTKLIDAETKNTGAVRREIYFKYIKAASYWILAILGFTIVVRETGLLGQRFWIKHWAESYDRPHGWRDVFGFPSATERVMPYVLVYLAMQLAVVLLMVAVYVPSLISTLRASRILFRQMLESILRSPTRFFDKTPAGRIINRFSKDIGWIDGSVSAYMRFTVGMIVSFLISAATVTLSVPPFVLVLVPLMWLHLWVARGYITAGRDLTRLRSTTYSPVINLFSEVLHGLTTIRAFNAEYRFCESIYLLLDRYHWTDYCRNATDTWLSYRFEVLGSIVFLTSAWLGIYIEISSGLLAIVITQAQNIMLQLAWGLNMYVGMENGMNSVERVQEYIDLPAEPLRRVPGVPAAWPFLDQGITFKDVVLRYAPDLDPVLRGISFHVKAGEKIGIVGRTGSGKSTLAMSLFRFVDPDEGTISVGGMDITKVGVQDLREHLTLIPQDAALYGGTIRENLDPFNEHTDAECIDALRMVQLPIEASSGSATPSAENAETTAETGSATQTIVTLESKVSDGGANWSAGQRQLIAMARALLRNSGIVVLDESTASVDFETDKKIQMTIRERFIGSILLTIAHRLHTIIDYDRVLVLDHGKVVEFDTPAALMGKEGGVFRGMCEQSGHFAELRNAAEGKMLIVV